MWRCDGHGKKEKGLRRLSLGRKCNSHQEGVKGIRNECQLIERCDGHGGGVMGMERCDGYQGGVWRYGKARQLRGSVTVIREMWKVLERCVS